MLVLLLAINAVNFIDRTIVNILSQPIKADLHLADWQIGLMVGAAGDILVNHAFAGDFSALCPGGAAPHGAGAGVKAACMQTSATGIQRAIAGCAAVYAWAGLHLALAGRAMGRKQDPAI